MKGIRITKKPQISQGDIYENVEFIEYAIEEAGVVDISKIVFPFVVVLTQDCDLKWDYTVRWGKKDGSNHDKKIISVIVAPLYNAKHVYEGKHLSELGMTMAPIPERRTPGETLRQNKTPRYHYLEFPANVLIPPSVIDFKHYFTVNVEYLKKHKKANFICQIAPLHREDLSQRFSSFLSRIGLPEK